MGLPIPAKSPPSSNRVVKRLRAMPLVKIASFIVLSLALTCDKAAAAPIQGWEMHIRHSFLKKMVVQICDQGIRIEGKSTRWGVIATPPTWDATCFNITDRKVCKLSYADWRKRGFAVIDWTDDLVAPPPNSFAQKGNYDGYPALIVRWNAPPPKMGLFSQSQMGPKKCDYTLVSTTAINAPPQIKQLLTSFFKMPSAEGLPVALSCSASPPVLLNTPAIIFGPIPADAFATPVGYKVVKTDTEVWINEEDKGEINDFGQFLNPGGSK